MLGNFLDNAIGTVFPKWGAARAAYRNQLEKVSANTSDHQSLRRLMEGRSSGGYEAGKNNRLTARIKGSAHENDLPRAQIHNMRVRSWNLYRNNPQARKVSRTLGAKVIGRGMDPQSQATLADGKPHVGFRSLATKIWDAWCKESDFRGKPGRGGQTFAVTSKTALRQTLFSGGVFYRFHHLSKAEQKLQNLLVPLTVQLVHADRLDENRNGDNQFYGVELDGDGKVAKYWILPGDGRKAVTRQESTAIPANEMGHLFMEEDVDQILGSPQFGAALLTMDDRRNYEYSELLAAEAASCVVGTYRRSNGQAQFGLTNPTDPDRPLTDTAGNPVTSLQPQMLLDLGKTGEFNIVSNNRPNNGAEGFLSYMMRSEAVAMPGVKSSSLTGDYRNSSFSSERSADNDIWPEIEELQDWFACGFCQPIYEEVITAAVVAGLFDKVEGFSVQDFVARKRQYLDTVWQGPVPRSINPKDDADAARARVKGGISTLQLECAKEARDWRANIDAFKEVIDYATEREIPEDIFMQWLGIEQIDQPSVDGGNTRTGGGKSSGGQTSDSLSEAEPDDAFHGPRMSGLHILNSAGAMAQ